MLGATTIGSSEFVVVVEKSIPRVIEAGRLDAKADVVEYVEITALELVVATANIETSEATDTDSIDATAEVWIPAVTIPCESVYAEIPVPKPSLLPAAPEPPASPVGVGEQSPVPTHTVSITRLGETARASSPRPKRESLM